MQRSPLGCRSSSRPTRTRRRESPPRRELRQEPSRSASLRSAPATHTWLSFAAVSTADDRLQKYAHLAIRVGVNLQPGQILAVNALVEHAPFAREIARAAYEAGASFVDVQYADQHVRRAHIANAAVDQPGYSPPWLVERYDELGRVGGALHAISGHP